jgi:hypothetical protein
MGWTYSATVTGPAPTLAGSANISSSPPGKAELELSQNVANPPQTALSDTNAGRPGGPKLEIADGVFWGTGTSASSQTISTLSSDIAGAASAEPFNDTTADVAGPCHIANPSEDNGIPGSDASQLSYYPEPSWTSYGFSFYCSVQSGSGSTISVAQSDVSAAVQTLSSLNPYFVLDFYGYTNAAGSFENCALLITPDGQTNEGDWNAQNCGTLAVSS